MSADLTPRSGIGLAPTNAGAAAFAHSSWIALGALFHATHAVLADRRSRMPTGRPQPGAQMYFVHWPRWCTPGYYSRHVAHQDPIRRWLDSHPAPSEFDVVRLSDLASDSESSGFSRALLQAVAGRFVLSIALRDGERVMGAISLVRSAAMGNFSDDDCALARSFTPMLNLAFSGTAETPARTLPPAAAALSRREREVARLAIAGLPNKSVAARLDLSVWTVKNHLRSIFEKTGARNRTELGALLAGGAPERP